MCTEDDLFDSAKFTSAIGDAPLSPTSLRLINSSSLNIASPMEVTNQDDNSFTGMERGGGAADHGATSSSTWQANYVNRMKSKKKTGSSLGQQLSSKSNSKSACKKSSSTTNKTNKKGGIRRHDDSLVQSGDALVNFDQGSQVVNIKAMLSDKGRVNIALQGDDSDDANLEDYLYEDDDSNCQ